MPARQAPPGPALLARIEQFFTEFPDFRSVDRCAREMGISEAAVRVACAQLYRQGRLGAYSLGISGPPQPRMRELLCRRLDVQPDWVILEAGPGANPVFTKERYPRCFSVDRYRGGMYGNVTGCPSAADGIAMYSTLASCAELRRFMERWGAFDLVFGSHSFEHEIRPVTGLRQVHSILKPGGWLALFVPDGYSSDPGLRLEPSHTLFLTPEMVEDLVSAAGGYEALSVSPWRPNWDQLILARRAA